MRSTRIGLVLLSVWLLAAPAGLASAQEGEGLSDVLTDLLRGSEGAGPTAGPDRRVPFGREEMQFSFAPLVKETAPAVVNVYASKQARAVRSPFEGDPFFEKFFGRQMRPRVQNSLGSGVIVDASGLVVTNFHVIRDADEVKVAMSDGREFTSKVLLKDESLDLAILKIDAPEPFPVVPIGDSDALEVGDLVLAVGNPFGVGQTTTSGIVSALARSHVGVSDFGFFIQTDAAINPGNSGGALINMAGQLVGVNTAIFSRSGGSIGIGFAIPSNMVRAVTAGSGEWKRLFRAALSRRRLRRSHGADRGIARHGAADRRACVFGGGWRTGCEGGAEARRRRADHERRCNRACRRAELPAGDADSRHDGRAESA